MDRERTNAYTPASPPESDAIPPVALKASDSPPMLANHNPELSLGALFTDLSSDFSTLVRQEIELARAETTEKISKAVRSAGMLVVGGLVAYAGVIVVLIAIAILLGAIMPYWLSSLIVGAVVLIIGAIMAISGKNKLANLSVVPEKTLATLKEDARWAKEQVS